MHIISIKDSVRICNDMCNQWDMKNIIAFKINVYVSKVNAST